MLLAQRSKNMSGMSIRQSHCHLPLFHYITLSAFSSLPSKVFLDNSLLVQSFFLIRIRILLPDSPPATAHPVRKAAQHPRHNLQSRFSSKFLREILIMSNHDSSLARIPSVFTTPAKFVSDLPEILLSGLPNNEHDRRLVNFSTSFTPSRSGLSSFILI